VVGSTARHRLEQRVKRWSVFATLGPEMPASSKTPTTDQPWPLATARSSVDLWSSARLSKVLSAGAIQTPKTLMHNLARGFDPADFILPLELYAPAGRRPELPGSSDHRWRTVGSPWAAPHAQQPNLFVKSRPELNTPDLHIWHIEAAYLSEVTGRHAVENVWSISPGLARPESRGFLRLKSASPQEAMEIHANMLTDPRDLAALRRSMEGSPASSEIPRS
jgi:hypothetical protein